MKVKLFTHTDLDGVGCAIVAKLAFLDVDIEYCDYDNVNGKISDYIVTEDFRKYNLTFITDISVDEQVAEMINECTYKEDTGEFILLDHHKTALWLNKYKWTCVKENFSEDMKNSGTHMFYLNVLDFYIENFTDIYNTLIDTSNFVEAVRRYDTWEWKDKYNDNNAKMLNDLMHLKGKDNFIYDVVSQLKVEGEFRFSKMDLFLLKQNQEKIDRYIEIKNKMIITKEINGYQAGVIFAEQYCSELGNVLSESHPELDFIVIINPSQSVSYRTVKNIDLSVIAKIYGGGGHPKSSGSPLSNEIREEIIDLIFE